MLRELLEVERARLQVALRIEAERKIVFPETTVIVKDIQRLLDAIAIREQGGITKAPAEGDDGQAGDEDSDAEAALRALE